MEILFEDNTSGGSSSYYFFSPIAVLEANKESEFESIFEDLESFVKIGYAIAGFVSYDSGEEWNSVPRIQFGIYKNYLVKSGEFFTTDFESLKKTKFRNLFQTYVSKASEINLFPKESFETYQENIHKIKKDIFNGEYYQLNYCFPLEVHTDLDSFQLYQSLKKKQPTAFNCFLWDNRYTIASFSPELFFQIESGKITTKPMKGTMKRGHHTFVDRKQVLKLRNSEKDRAENLMIVDLMRNDLSKISKTGTVDTERLFQIEKLQTVLQMTSTITSELKEEIGFKEIFSSLFPSGSIVGAPKQRVESAIQNYETFRRGIYTGAIGYFLPNHRSCFSVAIRTLFDSIKTKKKTYFVGSGITNDSVPEKEWEECLSKAKFLNPSNTDFEIYETLKVSTSGIIKNLQWHLKRLKHSCFYFSIPLDLGNLRTELEKQKKRNSRLRIGVLRSGEFDFKFTENYKPQKELHVFFEEIQKEYYNQNPEHKTSMVREYYSSRMRKRNLSEGDELIFFDTNGYLLEGTISTIFVKIGDQYFTPPLSQRILPGIFRHHLLTRFPNQFQTKQVHIDELKQSSSYFLCNSLRGIIKPSSTIFL